MTVPLVSRTPPRSSRRESRRDLSHPVRRTVTPPHSRSLAALLSIHEPTALTPVPRSRMADPRTWDNPNSGFMPSEADRLRRTASPQTRHLRSPRQIVLRRGARKLREREGLSQATVAKRLGKHAIVRFQVREAASAASVVDRVHRCGAARSAAEEPRRRCSDAVSLPPSTAPVPKPAPASWPAADASSARCRAGLSTRYVGRSTCESPPASRLEPIGQAHRSTPIRRIKTSCTSYWNKINPGFAVDLNNQAAKDLPRLLDLRLAAIPCDNDVWACPDLRSGRALSRGQRRPRDRAAFGVSALRVTIPHAEQAARAAAHVRPWSALRARRRSPVRAPWPQSAGWSDGGNRHVLPPHACGGPSPPIDAPRVRQPSARGNPPAAGPPLRSGPSEQARLGATGERLPRRGA